MFAKLNSPYDAPQGDQAPDGTTIPASERLPFLCWCWYFNRCSAPHHKINCNRRKKKNDCKTRRPTTDKGVRPRRPTRRRPKEATTMTTDGTAFCSHWTTLLVFFRHTTICAVCTCRCSFWCSPLLCLLSREHWTVIPSFGILAKDANAGEKILKERRQTIPPSSISKFLPIADFLLHLLNASSSYNQPKSL
jgi:hypothetical protein